MKYILKNNIDHDGNCGKKLLELRGVQNVDNYLTVDEMDLNDFMGLDNIVTAAACLESHIQKKSNIFIQVDSDCDGYTSAAMAYLYIKSLDPDAHVKWRVHAGKQHGIIVNKIPEGTDLLIVPDAGSNDYEQHSILREMGVDIIVLDHHMADYYSEDAIIVNNQLSDNYPNKALSGAGVVYKFFQCYDSMFCDKATANDYLDLAALSLVADMMDLREYETRYMITKGLKNIKNIGIKTLVEKQAYSLGDTKNITPTGIAFYIAPLINAIVRVGTQEEKETLFQAFIEGDKPLKSTKRGAKVGDTETAAEQTARVATNARNRQNKIKEKAVEEISFKIKKEGLNENQIIFIALDDGMDYDSALTGLIAMQLMSIYKKPVLLTKQNNEGFFRGSCRGDSNTELKDLKSYLTGTGFFEYIAGHPNAAGVSIHKNSIDSFIEQSNKDLGHMNFAQNMYDVDFIFKPTEDLVAPILSLGALIPYWGQGISEPFLVIENIKLSKKDFSFIGTNKDTIKFNLNGVTCIRFKDAKLVDLINERENFYLTVIGRASLNEWCGEVTPQIIINDYQISEYDTSF